MDIWPTFLAADSSGGQSFNNRTTYSGICCRNVFKASFGFRSKKARSDMVLTWHTTNSPKSVLFLIPGAGPVRISPRAAAAACPSACGPACKANISIINGTSRGMFVAMTLRWIWRRRTTIIGHSVRVLKLVILLARVFGAFSVPSSSSGPAFGLGENAGCH